MWPMQDIVYFGEYFSLLSGDQRATCAMKASSRMLYMFFRKIFIRTINIASPTRYRVHLSRWLSTYFTFCERKIKKQEIVLTRKAERNDNVQSLLEHW